MCDSAGRIMKLLDSATSGRLVERCLCRFGKSLDRARSRSVLRRLHRCGDRLEVYLPIMIEQPEHVDIGEHVSLGSYLHIWGYGGVQIGNRVMIASHVAISSLTHDYLQDPMRDTMVIKPVRIEDDAWIGSHAVILPGVTIGRGAVIGAGAVVTRDVAAGTVAVGIPARVLRDRRPRLASPGS